MNGNAKALRAAEYGRGGETHAQAARRLAHALDTDRRLRRALAGHGCWAGLAQHPRAAEFAALVEEDTTEHAQEHARTAHLTNVEVSDEALNSAIGQWLNTFQTVSVQAANVRGNEPAR